MHIHRSLAKYVIHIRDGNRTELEPNRTHNIIILALLYHLAARWYEMQQKLQLHFVIVIIKVRSRHDPPWQCSQLSPSSGISRADPNHNRFAFDVWDYRVINQQLSCHCHRATAAAVSLKRLIELLAVRIFSFLSSAGCRA